MKRTWTCPKCQGTRVGYFESLPDAGRSSQSDKRMIGVAFPAQRGFISVGRQVGEVEAFICTDCGYFEEYVKAPHTIPWDQVEHFRWCRT